MRKIKIILFIVICAFMSSVYAQFFQDITKEMTKASQEAVAGYEENAACLTTEWILAGITAQYENFEVKKRFSIGRSYPLMKKVCSAPERDISLLISSVK